MWHLFTEKRENKVQPYKAILNYFILCLILVAVFGLAIRDLGLQFDFSFVGKFKLRLWDGFKMTVLLSIVSLFLSLFLGVISAIGENSAVLLYRYLSKIYVKLIRGTPLIMQIYLFYYIIGTAFGVDNRFLSGVLILSVFEGAYISEIIRGSLLSIDETQLEAARAVGFTRKQTLRYVILPQLVARTLPALTGQFASIIKDSSLLSIISVIEMTQTIREISSTNFKLFECYIFLGILYLCLTLPISFISERFERRFRYAS